MRAQSRYSPELTQRKAWPSNLRMAVKTTVRAGMFRPMEKVSVANRHLISFSWNRISITYVERVQARA